MAQVSALLLVDPGPEPPFLLLFFALMELMLPHYPDHVFGEPQFITTSVNTQRRVMETGHYFSLRSG